MNVNALCSPCIYFQYASVQAASFYSYISPCTFLIQHCHASIDFRPFLCLLDYSQVLVDAIQFQKIKNSLFEDLFPPYSDMLHASVGE